MQKPRSGIAQISPAKNSLRWVGEDLRYRAGATRATTPQRLFVVGAAVLTERWLSHSEGGENGGDIKSTTTVPRQNNGSDIHNCKIRSEV